MAGACPNCGDDQCKEERVEFVTVQDGTRVKVIGVVQSDGKIRVKPEPHWTESERAHWGKAVTEL